MELKENELFWVMQEPDNNILHMSSMESTERMCWKKFLWPALNGETYKKAGWKPVKVKIVKV